MSAKSRAFSFYESNYLKEANSSCLKLFLFIKANYLKKSQFSMLLHSTGIQRAFSLDESQLSQKRFQAN
jgi:hypothetical protein